MRGDGGDDRIAIARLGVPPARIELGVLPHFAGGSVPGGGGHVDVLHQVPHSAAARWVVVRPDGIQQDRSYLLRLRNRSEQDGQAVIEGQTLDLGVVSLHDSAEQARLPEKHTD